MSYKITCDFCGELSATPMCDHCAEADEAGILDAYVAGRVPCPGCVREKVSYV